MSPAQSSPPAVADQKENVATIVIDLWAAPTRSKGNA